MKTIIIAVEEVWPYEAHAFATEAALLRFLRDLYPSKKRLRVKWWAGEQRATVLNHTTPIQGWFYRVWKVELYQ
jgi:hypothetical protein